MKREEALRQHIEDSLDYRLKGTITSQKDFDVMVDAEMKKFIIEQPQLNITFELYNYDKQEWEDVSYQDNLFDDYVVDSITRYDGGNDWRFRLSTPTENKPQLSSDVEEMFKWLRYFSEQSRVGLPHDIWFNLEDKHNKLEQHIEAQASEIERLKEELRQRKIDKQEIDKLCIEQASEIEELKKYKAYALSVGNVQSSRIPKLQSQLNAIREVVKDYHIGANGFSHTANIITIDKIKQILGDEQ